MRRLVSIGIILLLSLPIAFVPFYSKTASATFSSTTNLSSDAGASEEPEIAASGANVYAVWTDDTAGNFEILFSRSTNNGVTFSLPIDLSNNAGSSDEPQIAVSGSNVYIAWRDDTPGNQEVFFIASANNGATFGNVINVSSDSGDSSQPLLAASGSNAYVVWTDNTPGNYEIFFAASTNSGASFGITHNLSSNGGASTFPQMAISGTNVYIVWNDNTGNSSNFEIFFVSSTNGGAMFSGSVNLSNTSGGSFDPQIAAVGTNVYVVWWDFTPGKADVFFVRSTNNGGSFSSIVNLSNNSGASAHPQIAVSGTNVDVVWTDFTVGKNPDIFFRASIDSGSSFSSTINLSNNPAISQNPHLSTSGNNVYVVWVNGFSSNPDIFSRRSTDNGTSFGCTLNLSKNVGTATGEAQIAISGFKTYVIWSDISAGNAEIFFKVYSDTTSAFCSATINLSNNPGNSLFPQIAVSGSNVYVVWHDTTATSTGTSIEVIFEKSVDNGATFGFYTNLSNNTGSSIVPQIAVFGSNVYVVWVDDTSGNNEIMFRRSTNGGTSFGAPVDLSNNSGISGGISSPPRIVASGSKVYVTWSDNTPGNNDIFFIRSIDGGATFGNVKHISKNAGASDLPQIAVSGSYVYVVWQDNTTNSGTNDIFFARSANNGATFGVPINLSNNTGDSIVPQIAVSGSNVYVTWSDNVTGNYDIFFVSSINNGGTFTTSTNLSNNAGGSVTPEIAATGSNVYIAWEDCTVGGCDILFSRSTNNGSAFGSTANLSNNAGTSTEPQISLSATRVYVVWSDETLGNWEILFRASMNSGSSFGGTTNLSKNSGTSGDAESPPSVVMAVSGTRVDVAWVDDTPSLGSFEIFFKGSY